MARLIRKRSEKAGLPPGTLVHLGKEKTGRVKISIIDYDENQFQEKEVKDVKECFVFKDKPSVTWINIDGLHQIDIIEKIGERFGLHSLILEDILNTNQRPKMEDFENYIYVVLKMISYNTGKKEDPVEEEQISLVMGPNFVISFQETEGDVFDPIRERIRNAKGRIRKQGADYLVYSLMDTIVDNYFLTMEKLGEKIEPLEDEIVSNPVPETLQIIGKLKSDMIFLRKSVWPLRDVVTALSRDESPLINKTTGIYFRDVYDHTIQVIDTIETLRDMLSSMHDIYLSSVSNRMNEIMKVLTVIATIFMPLGFIAGIYGMNFNAAASPLNMPELNWPYGYIFALGIMFSVAMGMVVYFKRKRWF